MTTWNILYYLHNYPISISLSGTLAAKQLVVDKIHKIFSGPYFSIVYWIKASFVLNSSPSTIFSIIKGSKLAVKIHFKHVF